MFSYSSPISLAVLAVSLGSLAVPALAAPIPYPDYGSPTAAMSLTATTTGEVAGYFVGGNASDDDSVAMLDLTTGVRSGFMLDNHASSYGATVGFGKVTAGDSLEFVLYNQQENDLLYSGANNLDGVAHAYVVPFAGGMIGSFNYPSGIYAGFEDLLKSQASDFDYNDEAFVFTNVKTAAMMSSPTPSSPIAAAPEPASLALLGTGALGAVALLRRRTRLR